MTLFDGRCDDHPTCSFFDIDEEKLIDLANLGSHYWEKSYEFYKKVKHQPFDTLTAKQINWLESIAYSLETEHSREF